MAEMKDKDLTLTEHLAEVRQRLIVSLSAMIIGAAVSYLFAGQLIKFLTRPVGKLIFIHPSEAFFTYLKVALYCGFFLSLPVILFEIWRFVAVGLRKKEKKYTLIFGPISFVLFLTGALFAYFVVVPFGLRFLLGFGAGVVTPMITISNYISFLGMLLVVFGLVFQLPLISAFLTKLRLVTPLQLGKWRKQAVVLIFIMAAVLTPPDVFTQFLMAGPLLILYEISILVSKLIWKKPRPKRLRRPPRN